MNIKEALNNKTPILLDGSMGALLIAKGVAPAKTAAVNIENPDIITQIHCDYLKAGCDAITANTFNLSPQSIKKCGYSLEELVGGALRAALAARELFPDAAIALDLGPTGELIEPYGKMTVDGAYSIYKHIVEISADKVDFILLETFSVPEEIKAAALAAKAVCDLPVFAAMTFQSSEKSWMGASLNEWATLASELPVDAAGINCTLTPGEMLPLLSKLMCLTDKPVFAQPNKGQPLKNEDGNLVYPMQAEVFAAGVAEIFSAGVRIVGGCCGSDPQCMRLIREKIS